MTDNTKLKERLSTISHLLDAASPGLHKDLIDVIDEVKAPDFEFFQYVRKAMLVPSKGTKAVYDGDGTVHVYIDQGFYTERFRIRLRLARINAPEMTGGTEETRAAAKIARDRLYDLLSLNVFFWIRSVKKGKNGRWVSEIYLNDGTNVNDLMVAEGHAIIVDWG